MCLYLSKKGRKCGFFKLIYDGCLLSMLYFSAICRDAVDETLRTLLETIPLPHNQQAIMHGCKTSSYLTIVLSSINRRTFGEMKFQDSIQSRATLYLLNLLLHYSECNDNFTMAHAHSSNNDGNIIACHDEVTSELVSLFIMVFKPSTIQAKPRINVDPSTNTKSEFDVTVHTNK